MPIATDGMIIVYFLVTDKLVPYKSDFENMISQINTRLLSEQMLFVKLVT